MAKHSKARITLVGIFLLSFVLAGVAFWRTDLHTAWAGDSFPTVEIDGELFYIVRSGDSADALAEAFGVGVDELLDANELEAGVDLRIGQRLRVPATSDLYLRPADAEIITEDATEDADEEAAGEAGEDEESDGESTASRAAVVAPPVDDDVYIVRRGDSLQLIAQNTGVSVEDLVAFNNLTRAYPLYRGQELRLTRPSEEETEPENGMEETAPTARQYTVLRGDSLQIIARQFNISVEDLVAANDLGGRAYLYQGQILTIPAPESVFLAPSAASDSNASETDTDTDTGSGNAMEEDADTSGLESGEGTKGSDPDASATDEDMDENTDEDMSEDADAQGHIHNETHVALHTEMYGEPSAALALWQAVAEEQEADAGRIHVFSPAAGGAHHSQIEVIGLSQTFEGNVEMQLRAEDGEVLAERYTTGGSVDGYDFFRTGLRFTVQEPVSATLVVFEQSMQDGGMMQEVEIPLTLLPGQRFIDIHQPKEGARLCETVLLAGYSNTFEGNVSLEITDPAGEILALGYATGGTFGIYREFFHSFDFQSDSPTPILITAYELDAAGFYDRVDPITVPASYFPGDASECQ